MQSIGFWIFRFEPEAHNWMVLGNSSVQVRFVLNFQVCQNPPKLGADPVLWEKMFLCCFSLQAGRKDLHTGLKFHPPPPPPQWLTPLTNNLLHCTPHTTHSLLQYTTCTSRTCSHFLNLIFKIPTHTVPPETTLVTVNVKSLYTPQQRHEGNTRST